MRSHDVVVVGGRVAGAATALLLARAGARVALLDRSAHGSDTLSTHALMRAGVLQLARWDLLDTVAAAGTPPVRHTTFHYEGADEVHVSIRPGAGVDALYAPRRTVLDRILLDAAAEAGVEVLTRTTVTGLDGRDGRVTGVQARTRQGRSRAMRAAITVGADGIGSSVAREVAAPVRRRGRFASAVLYRYVAGLAADGYVWAYGNHAGAGLIPTNDGETCVFVATSPHRMRQLRRSGTEAAFTRLLQSAGPALARQVESASPTSRLQGWGGRPGYVRGSSGPGWALVGDAGYFKDPISTHGMTDALRDAELLSGAVLRALGGEATEPVALGEYEATRDRLSARLFAATEEVASYEWGADDIRAILRRVSSAMSDEVDHLRALPSPPGQRLPLGLRA